MADDRDSVTDRVTDALPSTGLVESRADVAIAALLAVGVVAGVVVALSPALAGYYVARSVGFAPFPALTVGLGGYLVVLLYIRFGGVTVNINN